ncbi:MAG: hypothetical protein PSX71_03745 [bacterium]|nr:hypothetical protein [bacterium]
MSSYQSPIEHLAAFAIAFVMGALSAMGLSRYIKLVKKEAQAEMTTTRDQPPTTEP